MKPRGFLLLAMLSAALPAAAPKIKAGPLELDPKDLIVTDKKTRVHVLWDAFPCADLIAQGSLAQGVKASAFRQTVAAALVEGYVFERLPKAGRVVVDVVELPEKDEYGAPKWSSVRKLEHLQFDLSSDGKAELEEKKK